MSPDDGAEEYAPKRGQIVRVDFGAPVGREQAGRRPAIVLSPASYNRRTGLMVACPVTSRVKGYPTEVALPEDLVTQGVVLVSAVRNLDWRARRAEFIEVGTQELFDEVVRVLRPFVGA